MHREFRMKQFNYYCSFNKEQYLFPEIKGMMRYRFQESGQEEIFFDNIFNDIKGSDILWIVDEKKYPFIERIKDKYPLITIMKMDDIIRQKIIFEYHVVVSDEDSLFGNTSISLLEINNLLDKYRQKNVLIVLDNVHESRIPDECSSPDSIAKHINDRSRNVNCKTWDKSYCYTELFQLNGKLYSLPLISKKSSRIRINLSDIKELGFIINKESRIYLTCNPLDTSIAILE